SHVSRYPPHLHSFPTRRSSDLPSSVEMRIPVDVGTLSQYLDIRKPIKLDDTSAPDLDHKIRFFAKSLGTRSLLVVPVVLDDEVRSEEHTSELQSRFDLVCRLLL